MKIFFTFFFPLNEINCARIEINLSNQIVIILLAAIVLFSFCQLTNEYKKSKISAGSLSPMNLIERFEFFNGSALPQEISC